MSEVVKIAEAVAAELADYDAELMFFPEFDLKELDDMRVAVVPAGIEYKTVSRSSHEELLKVSVGVLKRGCEDELPELLRLAEGIGLGFLNKRLVGASCVAVAFDPIYSPDHLRERGQFTSVIQLTFKQIR